MPPALMSRQVTKKGDCKVVAKTRKTQKTVEIHELYVIRTVSGSLPPLCKVCLTGDAIMIPPEQAALVAGVPARTIYRWVETEMVHFNQLSNGSIIVCVRSLPIAIDRVERQLE